MQALSGSLQAANQQADEARGEAEALQEQVTTWAKVHTHTQRFLACSAEAAQTACIAFCIAPSLNPVLAAHLISSLFLNLRVISCAPLTFPYLACPCLLQLHELRAEVADLKLQNEWLEGALGEAQQPLVPGQAQPWQCSGQQWREREEALKEQQRLAQVGRGAGRDWECRL